MSETAPTDQALERLREQVVVNWAEFPDPEALDALLAELLDTARAAPVQIITVTNPVSRPMRVRLAPIGKPADLDSFYHGEAVELAISDRGKCYLVYRRTDGGDYATEWSSATLIPERLMHSLPEVLAMAMFDGQD